MEFTLKDLNAALAPRGYLLAITPTEENTFILELASVEQFIEEGAITREEVLEELNSNADEAYKTLRKLNEPLKQVNLALLTELNQEMGFYDE